MKKIWILIILISFFAINCQTNVEKNEEISSAIPGSGIESEVLKEINYIRTNPEEYIKYLNNLKKDMNGNTLNLPNGISLKTKEGETVIDETISDLKKISGLKPINFSRDLSEVSNVQLTDLKENINLRHRGKDGSNVQTRASRKGVSGEAIAEGISLYAKDPKTIVLSLIVDDGVSNRIHRRMLLDNRFNQLGISYGQSNSNIPVCVLVFADRFQKLGNEAVVF